MFSKRTSAHVTTVHKVDMTRIAKLRDSVKGDFQAHYGFSLTFLPFVMRATAAALRPVPDPERFDRRHQHHLPSTTSTSASPWRWRTA